MSHEECPAQPVIKPGQGFFDNSVSNLTTSTLPFWHSIGASPNILTVLGIVSTALCLWFYSKRSMWCIFFLFLRSYFDWVDGQFARKYGPITKFGDYLDHLSDMACLGGIIAITLCKYQASNAEILCFFVLWILAGDI